MPNTKVFNLFGQKTKRCPNPKHKKAKFKYRDGQPVCPLGGEGCIVEAISGEVLTTTGQKRNGPTRYQRKRQARRR